MIGALAALREPTFRRVINATGVILHTNLGRAPLGTVEVAPGYSNLEYDLTTGRRGKRDAHVSGLLERLLGAPAIVVNNGAAAVFLVAISLLMWGLTLFLRETQVAAATLRIPEDYLESHREI